MKSSIFVFVLLVLSNIGLKAQIYNKKGPIPGSARYLVATTDNLLGTGRYAVFGGKEIKQSKTFVFYSKYYLCDSEGKVLKFGFLGDFLDFMEYKGYVCVSTMPLYLILITACI